MSVTTSKSLAGIGLAALLALTACGDGSDAESTDADLPDTDGDAHSMPESDGTFDFTPDTAAASGEELRIEVPQDLADASEGYNENRVLDAVTVRATDDTDSQCAIEVTYEYRDGVQDEIENNKWVRTSGPGTHGEDLPAEERYKEALTLYLEDLLADDHESAVFEMDCAASPNETENARDITFNHLDWQEGHYDLVWYDTEASENVQEEHDMEPGTTCADIYEEHGSVLNNCQEYQAVPRALATAHVTVMASGELHVVDSEVEGFNYEPEHGWIGDDQQVDSDGNVIDG